MSDPIIHDGHKQTVIPTPEPLPVVDKDHPAVVKNPGSAQIKPWEVELAKQKKEKGKK